MSLLRTSRFLSQRLFGFEKSVRLFATNSGGSGVKEGSESTEPKTSSEGSLADLAETETTESSPLKSKLPPIDLTNLVKSREPKDNPVYKEFERSFEEFKSSYDIEAPEVDFDAIRKKVRFIPYVVDELETLYKNFKAPPLDNLISELVREVDEYYQKILQEAAEIDKRIAERNRSRREIKQKIQYIQDNVDTLTVDEYLELFPKLKEEIEEDIKERRWLKGMDV
eukprot:jgi/Galph1/1089/GphlegSOOS_G5841.1